ncbi:hypothetical protein LS68_002930 [Helicobacter sp. MIT 05-5293]|uniref:hypothetical protein n=1 Tax=Helicobacter sp. MIT 05-5293 TaxID=1548149 RepID=UPI00051D1861|nr:hypothetical protein [Helicobacter sp. MIT 05-5293]TLD81983.1 hypothetical protein LS68_002930 [Helicobacter sp. MIT 05-5293]
MAIPTTYKFVCEKCGYIRIKTIGCVRTPELCPKCRSSMRETKASSFDKMTAPAQEAIGTISSILKGKK